MRSFAERIFFEVGCHSNSMDLYHTRTGNSRFMAKRIFFILRSRENKKEYINSVGFIFAKHRKLSDYDSLKRWFIFSLIKGTLTPSPTTINRHNTPFPEYAKIGESV